MAKSRTYRCEDRKCAQTWVCANLRRTQSHLPWEIPALMWNQQQSHLPGYKPGLQIILLTMTVILDLEEQRGRNFKTSSPSIQVKQDYRKNRQVCNLEQKLLWPMHQEWQSQWRTELPGTAMSECPSENPITPKRSKTCALSRANVHFTLCLQDRLKNPSPFLAGWNASYIAGMTKSFLESWCNQKFYPLRAH